MREGNRGQGRWVSLREPLQAMEEKGDRSIEVMRESGSFFQTV